MSDGPTQQDPVSEASASRQADRDPRRDVAAPSSVRERDLDGRLRLLAGTLWVCFLGSLSGVLWTIVNGPATNLPVTIALAAGLGSLLVALRKTRALGPCLHAFNAVIAIGIVGLAIRTQGQTGPPFTMLPLLPLLAGLIGGRRSGLVWCGLSLVGLGVCWGAMVDLSLPEFQAARLPDDLVNRSKLFGTACMIAMVTGVCVTASRMRRESIEALVESRQLAEVRYQQVLAQQKDLERVLADEAEMRDQFFSHVSHELRTPLTPLHQFLTLLLDEIPGPIDEEQRAYLEVALRNANQIGKLIGDLTDAARLQSGNLRLERRVVEPAALVENALAPFRDSIADKQLEVELEVEAGLRVCCDPSRASRVLQSLLENAIRFSPEGGLLTLRVEHDPERDDEIVWSVSDQGPGIPEDARKRIFESLVQIEQADWQSRQGLGLGLFIAHSLVERMGGRLWAESAREGGARLRFTLPRYDLAAEVAKVIDVGGVLQDELGLLVIRSPDVGDADRARVSRAVADELALVLYPHADVVLPADAPEMPAGAQIALTRTTTANLDGLIERLEAHFRSEPPLGDAATRVRVDGRPVVFFHDSDRAASIARATRRVEEALERLAAGLVRTDEDTRD